VDDAVPVIVRHGGEGIVAGDAGVAHHTVERSVIIYMAIQSLSGSGAVAHVETQQVRSATQLLHRLRHFLRFFPAAAVVHAYVKSGFCQTQSYGPAYAAAGTSYQNTLVHSVSPVG
jgi:hypothetical protein